MLINYSYIIKKYNLNIKNILHVGAHMAEEHEEYIANGCEKIVWVESNSDLVKELKMRLDPVTNVVLEATISDKDDEEVEFMVTNNGQSSSILNLGIHKQLFPNIIVQSSIKKYTKTLNSLFKENNLNFNNIDFVNLDIQGAELLALRGIGENLKNAKAIFTEINVDYVYEDCALVHEIDEYLSNFNFKRIETKMWENHPWGDALYIKN